MHTQHLDPAGPEETNSVNTDNQASGTGPNSVSKAQIVEKKEVWCLRRCSIESDYPKEIAANWERVGLSFLIREPESILVGETGRASFLI
jgi:hypothetical protein